MWLLYVFLLCAVSLNITDSESRVFSLDRPLLPAKLVQPTVHYHYYHHPATLGHGRISVTQANHGYPQYAPIGATQHFVRPTTDVVTRPVVPNQQPSFYQIGTSNDQRFHTVDPGGLVYRLADGSIYRVPQSGLQLVRPVHRSRLNSLQSSLQTDPHDAVVNYNAGPPPSSIIDGTLDNGDILASYNTSGHLSDSNSLGGGKNIGNILGGHIGVYTDASIGVSHQYPFIRNPLATLPQLNIAPTQPFRLAHGTPLQFNPAHFKPDFTRHTGYPTFNHNIGATHVGGIGPNYQLPPNYYTTAPHPAFKSHTFPPNFNGNTGGIGVSYPYSDAATFPASLSHSGIHYGFPSQPGQTSQPGVPIFEGNLGSSNIGSNTIGSSNIGGNTVGSNTVGTNTVGSNNLGGNTIGSNNIGGNTIGSNTVGSNTVDSNNSGGNINLGNPNNVVGNNNLAGNNNIGSSTIDSNNLGTNNLGGSFNNNNIGDSNNTDVSIGINNTDSNPGFYVGGDVFDNVASGGIVGPYLAQARVGQLDPYPYKQLCGEARSFKRILTTCYSNGQCQKLELKAEANDGRSQDNVHARSPVVKDKCRQQAQAGGSVGKSTDEVAVRSTMSAKRPRDRRLIPYTEVVLKQYQFN